MRATKDGSTTRIIGHSVNIPSHSLAEGVRETRATRILCGGAGSGQDNLLQEGMYCNMSHRYLYKAPHLTCLLCLHILNFQCFRWILVIFQFNLLYFTDELIQIF